MLRLQSVEPESPNQHDAIAIYGCANATFDKSRSILIIWLFADKTILRLVSFEPSK